MDYFLVLVISILYFAIRVVDYKFMKREDVPTKQILRECLGVAGSVVGGTFILEQFNSTISEGGGKGTFVFTDEPQF